ncbi:hypothetical protein ASAC_0070 [Acidilobus saccharovorans 345-15]|uniref:Uncharacterized protein n=1 Tax=Acidilobus saccharovorans (strain DSM 16705 / JCM 18335 / VKM B-2471 / 345-15) TaxID=666510 RepID=D9PZJ0_ACIS3|nr:hypothetical protein [Acidilobus saccharovorans]ADL18478.1 hypothetical protein ASAC_0070 [Acidilobus saccharovorans 345-15]
MNWDDVVKVVLSMPPHRDLALLKSQLPSPRLSGFRRRWLSEPRGQRADWEKVMPDGRSVHVREYRDHYLVHWDIASPSRSALRHLVYDAPHWLIVAVAAAVTAISVLLGPGAKVGAAGGLMATGNMLLGYRRSLIAPAEPLRLQGQLEGVLTT